MSVFVCVSGPQGVAPDFFFSSPPPQAQLSHHECSFVLQNDTQGRRATSEERITQVCFCTIKCKNRGRCDTALAYSKELTGSIYSPRSCGSRGIFSKVSFSALVWVSGVNLDLTELMQHVQTLLQNASHSRKEK